MTDEYATLRAAEAAGARIQAYTYDNQEGDDGGPITRPGYWRTLEGKAEFTCHPFRYRVHPEDVA